MELIRHRANSLQIIANEARLWHRFEIDVWANRGRPLVRHHRAIGPLIIGKRGKEPVLGFTWHTLYFADFLNELATIKLPLLVDLKGRWRMPDLILLLQQLHADSTLGNQTPSDVICSENWGQLDSLRTAGAQIYQVCYSAGSRRQLARLGERVDDIARMSVDWRILNETSDLAIFHKKRVKVFMWGLGKNFQNAKLFRALQDQGYVQGLTLDNHPYLKTDN